MQAISKRKLQGSLTTTPLHRSSDEHDSQGTGARHIEVQIMGFLAAKTPLEGASFGRYIAILLISLGNKRG